MILRIAVTKTDIKEGKVFNSTSCPIARAIKRRIVKNPRIYIMVGSLNCKIYKYSIKTTNLTTLELPEKAIGFINKYDKTRYTERESIKPISFKLDIPDELLPK